ncbi:Glucose/Sorbosone dehydrogenase [Gracilaria domingensis]|nr:Glucose/Sorbosone dehydrogenase [Gracilaria domingensis]
MHHLTLAVLFAALGVAFAQQHHDSGFDHRAHSVPGLDQTVYDIDGSGFETVHLDGIGSHSHYFEPGPPIVSGVITTFTWRRVDTNQVVCNTMQCDVQLPVGTTEVSLTVVDNTGDTVSDSLSVTVLPRSALTEPPRIDALGPAEGTAAGGNTVTIDGAYLYRDTQVFFGAQQAFGVEHVDRGRITCTAPGGTGTVTVTVRSSMGTSNGLSYTYQEGNNVPIRFKLNAWKNPDNSEYIAEEITCIVLGRDHRYYMGSLLGTVTVAFVNRDLVVESKCTGANMGEDRSITGIGYNPVDPYARVFAAVNTHFHENKGMRWDNANIESIEIEGNGCPRKGPTIITGLPVSNHDHGVGPIAFLADGSMLISIGSFTNAGVSKPGDGIGGVPENPLSAAIVRAPYLQPGFNGNIRYDQYDDPSVARKIAGDVEPYVTGIRNSFGMVRHSNGQTYITDNGPNTGFGLTSTSCTGEAPDAESQDKLLRLVAGAYYGHPNRNRGRTDPKQCVYKDLDQPSGNGFLKPIGIMTSSTNGLIEYRSNTFNGALKTSLLMSKVAFGANGLVWRAELHPSGNSLMSQPYRFFDQSGVSLTEGLYGELVMPQLKKYRVLALQADEPGPKAISIVSVHPTRGPKTGGTEVFITGHFLNSPSLVITFGGVACTNIVDIKYQHVRCITPAGNGKVPVVAMSNGVSSRSYGHEFEYM